jgi:hypothetical protein
MKKVIGFCLVVFVIIIAGSDASSATATDNQVKILMRRYEQVEAQLDRSVRYSKREVSGDETTIEQAWFSGAGDPIKVATERIAPGHRELTEYFALDFDLVHDGMFVLTRKETAQADGTMQVDESRQCFSGEGELIRHLTKSARFKPGESTDTAHIPNVTVDLSKQPKEQRTDAELLLKPQTIVESLKRAGPPDSDPFANVKGDSEKFRVISGTASPDGRYAVALGYAEGKIDWEELKDPDFPGTYSAEGYDYGEADAAESKNGKIVNYVVDLTTRRLLGTTGCGFFGTGHHYNMRECEVLWSPDSKNFVELNSDKWNYVSCRAGRIAAGPKLVGTVDLGKCAEETASNYLGKHKHGSYEGSIAISMHEVTDQGVIGLTIMGQGNSGEHKGELYFSVAEQIRVRETPAGLRLEMVKVRNALEE